MKKSLLLLWILALSCCLSAQEMIVWYEVVTGQAQYDTVQIFLQNNDNQSRSIGAVSFTVAFNQAEATPSLPDMYSLFSVPWSNSYSKTEVVAQQVNREGVAYTHALRYGSAAFQARPLIVPGNTAQPWLVLKIPFLRQGNFASFHVDTPVENPTVEVGAPGGVPMDVVVLEKGTPFPVEWVYFTATPQEERTVLLKWATASELNNKQIILEKSYDGRDFTPLSSFEGVIYSSAPRDYSHLDETPMFHRNYYRLVQVDIGGLKTYSEIVEVNFESTSRSWLNVYPIPAGDYLVLEPQVEVSGNHFYSLVDVNGRLISSQKWVPLQGKVRLSLKDLSPAVYILRSKDQTGKVDYLRIVKN